MLPLSLFFFNFVLPSLPSSDASSSREFWEELIVQWLGNWRDFVIEIHSLEQSLVVVHSMYFQRLKLWRVSTKNLFVKV